MSNQSNGHTNGHTNGSAKKPSIFIIGPGVVGQATGKVFAKFGYDVSFLGSSNEEKRKKLMAEGYKVYKKDELFNGDYTADISFIIVPTPTFDGKISLDAVKSAAVDLGKRLKTAPKKYHLVVVKSTVPPGSTESIVIPLIEANSGLKVGVDFGVCMNPEYLREETSYEDSLKPWVILIGQYDQKSGDILEAVYAPFKAPIYRCKLKEAEMQKYVHNLFNAVKIAFFNEMRGIGHKINVDPEKIFETTILSCEGLWNPKYGTKNKGPFSGSCLPKDTKAFFEWAVKNNFSMPLLEMTIKVNHDLELEMHQKESKVVGLEL